MLNEGQRAPAFTLPGTDGSEIDRYALSDHLVDGPTIVAFFLFDFHPACTEQLCSLRDLSWFEFVPGASVFAISTDRAFSHRAFAESHGLDFVLLSDSDGSVSERYDVLYDEFEGHKRVAKRSVFVVDTDATIRYAWSTDDASQQPDWAAVKRAVESLAPA